MRERRVTGSGAASVSEADGPVVTGARQARSRLAQRAADHGPVDLFDLLGRRWTLRVLWELRDGALSFRELQARCEGMSSSVLNQRLRELRDAGIVTVEGGEGYALSDDGRELLDALMPLHTWAERWRERI